MKYYLLFYFILLSNIGFSQPEEAYKLENKIVSFLERIKALHGNVFVDTSVANLDSNTFAIYKERDPFLDSICRIFAPLDFEPSKFTFTNISYKIGNILSLRDFYGLKERSDVLPPNEAIYGEKLDSLIQVLARWQEGQSNLSQTLARLLVSSSFWKMRNSLFNRNEKKLVRVLEVFTSKNYTLIFYSISRIYATIETKLHYDLIIN